MDDTAQKSQNDPVSQPVASQIQQSVVQQQPPLSQPTPALGSMHKEALPVSSDHHIQPAPHESQPEISKEIAEHVEVTPDHEKPHLTPDQKAAGVMEAKESVPIQAGPTDAVAYPMTDDQIVLSQKLPASDPVRWLGSLILRQWKKAHQALQKG